MTSFRAAWQNLRRHTLLSATILAAVTTALLAFLAAVTITLLAESTVELVQKNAGLTIEIRDGADDFQIAAALRAVKELPSVQDATLIPAETALEKFRQRHGELADFIDEYDLGNPLPAALSVEVLSPTARAEVLNFLGQEDFAGVVDSRSAWQELREERGLGQLTTFSRSLQRIGWGISALLFLFAGTAVALTLRLAFAARAEERRIAALVGAPASFQRVPLLWEILFFGSGGAALALAFFLGLSRLLSPALSRWFAGSALGFSSFWGKIFPGDFATLADFAGGSLPQLFALSLFVGVGGTFLFSLRVLFFGTGEKG